MNRECTAGTLAAAFLAAAGLSTHAARGQSTAYDIDASSTLVQEFCLAPCACPYQRRETTGLTGGFTLTFVSIDPLFTNYSVEGVRIEAQTPSGPLVLTGSGEYRVGGEVAVQHRLTLSLTDDAGFGYEFTMPLTIEPACCRFPEIAADVRTEIVACRRTALSLLARPGGCIADFNGSGGTPDDADVAAFFLAWSEGDESADINRSGGTPDDADIALFFQHWDEGC